MSDWTSLREQEMTKDYWPTLQQFVDDERSRAEVYPPEPDVYAALDLTPYDQVKVVILGQDPYHGDCQAHGLAFSVRPGVKTPSSLKNIFKELKADLGLQPPSHGNLTHWASQGVLLLNPEHSAHSAFRGGRVAPQVLARIHRRDPAGPRRQARADGVHAVGTEGPGEEALRRRPSPCDRVTAPSGLSAYKGFFGSKPFSQANEFLVARGREPVDWHIPDL